MTIVVGVDGSEGSLVALRWALDDAKRRGAGTKVVAVTAWEYPALAGYGATPFGSAWAPPVDLSEATQARLVETIEAVRTPDDQAVDVIARVAWGGAANVLLDEGRTADLLVVGSRGLGGFAGLLMGSVSHHMVVHAPCPVVVVPTGTLSPP